jgi:hypothetical protein
LNNNNNNNNYYYNNNIQKKKQEGENKAGECDSPRYVRTVLCNESTVKKTYKNSLVLTEVSVPLHSQ